MIYLDNAATTEIAHEVIETLLPSFKQQFANPSARHRLGVQVRETLESCRERIASWCGVPVRGVVFTSGGTEANNLAALRLRLPSGTTTVLSTAAEHPSLLRPLRSRPGYEWRPLRIGSDGVVDLEDLEKKLDRTVGLVALFEGHNEIGSLQKVREITALVRSRTPRALIHLDAVQSFGKAEEDLLAPEGVTSRSISAHKFHGPKGIGALLISEPGKLEALILGGGQEHDLRGGTENVPGILGLCKAVELLVLHGAQGRASMRECTRRMREGIRDTIPGVRFLVDGFNGLPHILSAVFDGVPATALLHHLEQHEIFTSAGAACHSNSKTLSPALKEIGLTDAQIRSTLRLSVSRFTTTADVETLLSRLPALVKSLRNLGAAV